MYPRGPRSLTAAQQYGHIAANPLCTGAGRLRPGRFTWRYSTAPTPMSRSYCVRLNYRLGGPPRVVIERPNLAMLSSGRRLPHVYDQQPPRLCLYRPTTGEWVPSMRIDQTIVPWVVLWLFYFEEWLFSDVWKGGGVHAGAER